MIDVLVQGGGPAGVVAATGLARLGFAVHLASVARPPSVEGLSERVLRALEGSGCAGARAALGPPVRREVTWNGAAGAPNVEWIVARGIFDAALIQDARDAGVTVHGDARAAAAHRRGDHWRVEVGGRPLDARLLIDARGRRALGDGIRGPSTVALARFWTGLPRVPRSAIASFANGFAWFATTGDGHGVLQFFVDGQDLPGRPGLDTFYDTKLAAVVPARDWRGDAAPLGRVRARHAGMSRSAAPSGPAGPLIGDAALALDPLAGHGVFEAIASGTAAVPAVRTILERPGGGRLRRRSSSSVFTMRSRALRGSDATSTGWSSGSPSGRSGGRGRPGRTMCRRMRRLVPLRPPSSVGPSSRTAMWSSARWW